MTDDTTPNRRQGDAKLDYLVASFEKHVTQDSHGIPPREAAKLTREHQTMNDGFVPMQRDITALLETVEGKPIYNALGDVIGYDGGMRNSIDKLATGQESGARELKDIKHLLGNGNGLKMTLAAKDRIYVALIGGGALLGAAWIAGGSPSP